jgi:hypothetical protein
VDFSVARNRARIAWRTSGMIWRLHGGVSMVVEVIKRRWFGI